MTTSPSFPLLAGIEGAAEAMVAKGWPIDGASLDALGQARATGGRVLTSDPSLENPYWTMPPRCPLLACSARQGTVAPHSHPPRFVPLSW